MTKLATTGKWRNIIEISYMSNNDEVVFYSDEEVEHKHLKQIIQDGAFNDPKLVMSRPVFDFEVAEELNTSFRGRRYFHGDEEDDEKAPDVTLFLDAYFIIKKHAELWQEVMKEKFSPTQFLAHYIGGSYYDCMSGGFPIYELMICRMLTQDSRIDKSEYVYPGPKEHKERTGRDDINLQDFLEDTKDVEEKFRDKLHLLLEQFGFPMLLTSPNTASPD